MSDELNVAVFSVNPMRYRVLDGKWTVAIFDTDAEARAFIAGVRHAEEMQEPVSWGHGFERTEVPA